MTSTDREQFIEQVREHHAGLRGFVRSLGVEPLRVDDVGQEVFIVAYNRHVQFQLSACLLA